jgi:hypothetical protein
MGLNRNLGQLTEALTESSGNVLLNPNNTVGGTNVYIGQTMASNDWWRIYGNTPALDRGEMVFELGDNAIPHSSIGQRFRFFYNNAAEGVAKNPFILDYNDATFNTNVEINGALRSSSVKANGRIYSTSQSPFDDLTSTTGTCTMWFDTNDNVGYIGSRNYSTGVDLPLQMGGGTGIRIFGNGNVFIGSSPSDAGFRLNVETGGRVALIKQTAVSLSNGFYALDIDNLAHGSNMTTAGAFRISTNGNSGAFVVNGIGNVGVGTTPLTALTVKSTNDNGYALTRPSNGSVYHWRLSTTEAGADAYSVNYNTFNNNTIFTTYVGGGTGGNVIWRTGTSGAGSEIERMCITSDGALIFTGSSTGLAATGIVNNNSELAFYATQGGNTTKDMFFQSGGSVSAPRTTIKANGNVLIGTTSDNGYKLRVNGNIWLDGSINCTNGAFNQAGATSIYLSNTLVSAGNSSGTTGLYMGDSGSGVNILTREKQTNNTARTYIYTEHGYNTQNVGAYFFNTVAYQGNNSSVWGVVSDIRIKENIRPINNSLDKILSLKPCHFEYKTNLGKIKTGFIAQEFEQVLPGHVINSPVGIEHKEFIPEDNGIIKSIDTDLIPYLVAAIQELKAEIEILKQNK